MPFTLIDGSTSGTNNVLSAAFVLNNSSSSEEHNLFSSSKKDNFVLWATLALIIVVGWHLYQKHKCQGTVAEGMAPINKEHRAIDEQGNDLAVQPPDFLLCSQDCCEGGVALDNYHRIGETSCKSCGGQKGCLCANKKYIAPIN